MPENGVRHLPVRRLRQRLAQAPEQVVDDRSGSEIEPDPDEPFALLVRDRGVAEGEYQAARERRSHAAEAPHRVRQFERALDHAFRDLPAPAATGSR